MIFSGVIKVAFSYLSDIFFTECWKDQKVVDASEYDKNDCWGTTACQTDDYGAEWVLENTKDCNTLSENIWFGKKGAANQFIAIDLGCARQIMNVTLINHFNTVLSRWGSKDFVIEITRSANINQGLEEFYSGTLPDESQFQSSCTVGAFTITVEGKPAVARMLKFTAINFYGSGAALQYINIM